MASLPNSCRAITPGPADGHSVRPPPTRALRDVNLGAMPTGSVNVEGRPMKSNQAHSGDGPRTDAIEAGFDYFEHGADIGVIGRGASLEGAFVAAAAATFAIMAEPSNVGRDVQAAVEFTENDVELALVQWLNALLAAAREERAVFAEFQLDREGDQWRGTARGAHWQPDTERGTEVKGATLTALAVRPTADGWEARCVVDV